MKTLCTILISCISISVFAQKIHFTDTTNDWKIVFVFVGDPTPEYSFYEDFYLKDTIINTKIYRDFSGIGFVREDTILKKVFIIDNTTDSENVLMDYNLVVGDTFRYNSFLSGVAGIDSTLINGIWYKVWYFDPIGEGWQYQIVEGIGCVQSPIYITDPRSPESYIDVYCFSNKGITPTLSPQVAFLDNITSCDYRTNLLTKEIKNNSALMHIFPNPANDELTIQNDMYPCSVSIINIMGQTIKR
jgi:hypothetical protein